MKFTSWAIVVLLATLLISVVVVDILLKRQYVALDKSNVYWTYTSILDTPFRYLKIKGGNQSNVVFEQRPTCSVRVNEDWRRNFKGEVRATVSTDTLYLDFDFKTSDPFVRDWLKRTTTVRLFGPELTYVEGSDTRFEMENISQKGIRVSLIGRSDFEVEYRDLRIDSIIVSACDSSRAIFELAPEVRAAGPLKVKQVRADLRGVAFMDIAPAFVDSLSLKMEPRTSVSLSGAAFVGASKKH